MSDTIRFITLFLYMCAQEFAWVLFILYAVAHAVYLYYFWESETAFPILSVVPVFRVWFYRQLSGVSWLIIAGYTVFSIAAVFLPSLVIWGLWLLFAFLLEFKYAQVNTACNPILYALLPPYKLFYLFKEAKDMN